MRLLIVNFELDEASPVLAWQARVACELARHCEKVAVVTERVGRFQAPENLEVLQLPLRPFGVPRRLGGAYLANLPVYRLCRRLQIDACFCHMAHEWTYRLKPTLGLLGIPILLWYAHGSVSDSLTRALNASTRVVTSTPDGFRIPSPKVRIIGQGIDTKLFQPESPDPSARDLIYVGRISPRKRIDLLIDAMCEVHALQPHLRLRLVGPTLNDADRVYERDMRRRCQELSLDGCVDFVGPMAMDQIHSLYASAFLHVNVSKTGSMDKTVLESLSCGVPVLTSNEAFLDALKDWPEMLIHDDRPSSIADQVVKLYSRRDQFDRQALRSLVVGRHDLTHYCGRLMEQLREIA